MAKEALLNLITEISEQEFGFEKEAVEIAADDIYDKASKGQRINKDDYNQALSNRFDLATGKTIVEMIGTLFSTIKVFFEIRNITRPAREGRANLDLLKAEWSLELIKNGLDKAKADKIVEKNVSRLMAIYESGKN